MVDSTLPSTKSYLTNSALDAMGFGVPEKQHASARQRQHAGKNSLNNEIICQGIKKKQGIPMKQYFFNLAAPKTSLLKVACLYVVSAVSTRNSELL